MSLAQQRFSQSPHKNHLIRLTVIKELLSLPNNWTHAGEKKPPQIKYFCLDKLRPYITPTKRGKVRVFKKWNAQFKGRNSYSEAIPVNVLQWLCCLETNSLKLCTRGSLYPAIHSVYGLPGRQICNLPLAGRQPRAFHWGQLPTPFAWLRRALSPRTALRKETEMRRKCGHLRARKGSCSLVVKRQCF